MIGFSNIGIPWYVGAADKHFTPTMNNGRKTDKIPQKPKKESDKKSKIAKKPKETKKKPKKDAKVDPIKFKEWKDEGVKVTPQDFLDQNRERCPNPICPEEKCPIEDHCPYEKKSKKEMQK